MLTIAHRGASATAPENTVAAVRRAVELGVDLVEVDVQCTRDHVLVLVHDATLVRTTDVRRRFPDRAPWRVADFTYAELSSLDAGSWFSPAYGGEPVPTLQDAFAAVQGSRAGLLVEVKLPEHHPEIVRTLVCALAEAEPLVASAGPLAVQSFSVAAMKELKAAAPAVPVGLLGRPHLRNLPALASWADQVNPPHAAADAGYLARAHDLGLTCHLWTIDSPTGMRRAAALGADGVITNRPELLVGSRVGA